MNKIESIYKSTNNLKREKSTYNKSKSNTNNKNQFNTIMSEIRKEMNLI